MLKLTLSGNVGQDAEIKDVGNRKAINFDVAVKLDYKKSSGEKVEKTEWVRAVIWKDKTQSIKVADYIKKGKKVLIEGVPNSSSYQDKNGVTQNVLHVTVKEIELIN